MKTTEEFIKEAKQVHGNKFDYSDSIYTGCFKNIKIICPKHGAFYTRPGTHLNGDGGCKKCAKEKQAVNKKDLNWFLKKCKEIHGNKYDYSLIKEFKTTHEKYKFICPKHGVFEQVGYSHLEGYGCRKCANENNNKEKIKTTEEFIKEAKQVHGNLYNYNEVNYTGIFKKIKIICKQHGMFEQTPNAHLQGQGCPYCIFKNQTSIATILKEKKENFKSEYKFKDLKDKCFFKI